MALQEAWTLSANMSPEIQTSQKVFFWCSTSKPNWAGAYKFIWTYCCWIQWSIELELRGIRPLYMTVTCIASGPWFLKKEKMKGKKNGSFFYFSCPASEFKFCRFQAAVEFILCRIASPVCQIPSDRNPMGKVWFYLNQITNVIEVFTFCHDTVLHVQSQLLCQWRSPSM